MPWSTPAGRAQLWRVVRLLVITLGSSAIVVNLVGAWEVRYPLLGVVIGLVEVVYRTVYPTMPATPPVARHATVNPAASGPAADQICTPATQTPDPSPADTQSPDERPDPAPDR